MLSISIDPEYNTRAKLKEGTQRFQLTFNNFKLLLIIINYNEK